MPIDTDSSREMVNVGVTAKLASPIYTIPRPFQSSSTDTDNTLLHSKYKKFLNENTSSQTDKTKHSTSDDSKTLYQLKTVNELGVQKVTPSKIEFLLYGKSQRRIHQKSVPGKTVRPKKSHSSMKRLVESESKSEECKPPPQAETSLVGKIKKSIGKIKKGNKNELSSPEKRKRNKDSRIDIYPFDHGCAEYLRTTDFAPQIISELLAQRATDYATRFWAEVFGSLHIGVAFFLTFFLQTYRFILHSVVKSVVVGFLQMTSDYGVKPMLTVLFNGFLQPSFIFVQNVLASGRDVLQPVSETLSNFLKPIGNLLRSVRLATIKVGSGKTMVKDV